MRRLLAALTAIAGCDGEPQPAVRAVGSPAPTATANPRLLTLPGAIWFVTDDASRTLFRIAGGERVEIARDVAPFGSLPDGRLVGLSAERLVLVGSDGSIAKLGPVGAEIREPAIARDGSWIAVAAQLEGRVDLYRIELPGGELKRLDDTRDDSRPAALDDDRIVFVSRREGNPEIYRADVRGGGTLRLTTHPGVDHEPTPSPDGTTIAFLSDREGPERIFLMNPDGSRQRRLTDRSEASRSESQVAWSPDGKLIAYVVERGVRRHVWLRDVATNREHDLTPEGIFDVEPAFSRDGRWIAVSRTRGHDIDLWAIPSDVGEPVRITTGRHADRRPLWR